MMVLCLEDEHIEKIIFKKVFRVFHLLKNQNSKENGEMRNLKNYFD
jgi:hypothetical protein